VDLSGKTALVTGGSLGLGRAMASAFHSAGANVALLARRDGPLKDAQKEIEEKEDFIMNVILALLRDILWDNLFHILLYNF